MANEIGGVRDKSAPTVDLMALRADEFTPMVTWIKLFKDI
jgi:hypothetical protein